MGIAEIIFYLFALVTCLSAAFILFTNNVLYAAFALVLALLGVAVMFIFAQAEFLAVAQIMVYVGGIVVLIIFGIMLTGKISALRAKAGSSNKLLALIITTAVLVALFSVIGQLTFVSLPNPSTSNLKILGIGIMSDYLLPFELIAILLLAALIGAAIIASKKEGEGG